MAHLESMPLVTSPTNTPRVAVVGGGIIGLSVAWRVAQTGADVYLFERGALAGEATHVAAGMVAPVSEADPAERDLLELGLRSAAAWPQFAADLEAAAGLEPGALLHTDGTLLVARDADEGRWLSREAELRRDLGLPFELLTPTQARRLEPDLAPGLRGALSAPGDVSVDPRALGAALEVAALEAGVDLHIGHELAGLDDPRLAPADRVVVCTGAWPLPGADAEVVRTHPVKGQLLMLRDPDHQARGEAIVTRTLRAQTVYVVPRGDGRYVIGATMEHRGYDRTSTAWAVHDLLRELFEVVP
ncbi:MAG: FAD-dependent oxidoreductase, partial [Solirubrobacteraceae bacterium]|nr:FAD-dependent oxidoreductase [Solirubrobacteraceae bacterium]